MDRSRADMNKDMQALKDWVKSTADIKPEEAVHPVLGQLVR
jgi:hypothetical protein